MSNNVSKINSVEFVNPDSHQKISIPIDKSLIFIYGKNGSGKTTFSRSNNLDPKFVFNEDFVYKNVYIIDADGAKTDSNIKNNFSELLIGEDVVRFKQEQNLFEEVLKKITEKSKSMEEIISSIFATNGINTSYNILKDLNEDKFKFNIDKDIDEQANNYKSDFKLEQIINNDDELKVYVNQIKKQENVTKLIEKVKRINLLNEYLFNDEKPLLANLNSKLKILNDNLQTIKELEGISLKKNVSKSDFHIIKDCINLHINTGQESCTLCGSPNAQEGIKEWQRILNDKFISLKTGINNDLKKIIDDSKQIINDKELYESIAPLTIKNIEKFIPKIEKLMKNICEDKITYLSYDEFEKELFTDDILKKINGIANYLLKNYKDKIIFYNSSTRYLNEHIKGVKLKIEEKLKENAETHKESINSILASLGLNKEISVDIDRLGGKTKYSLSIVNNNLSKLSDGQKHKLALAIFLNTIKNLDLKGKTLVFDDPVVSLDELGYHLFKEYLLKNVMNKENRNDNPKLIILTHNFNYLYIQISNIITNSDLQDYTKILKLNSDNFINLDFNLFKYDDIALFKNCINNIEFEDQLIDLSSLYNKIFREFLDLKLRITGEPLNGNPSEEIQQLNLDNPIKEQLQQGSNKLSSYSKNKDITIEEAKQGFYLLFDMLNKLGFQEYLNSTDKDRILTLIARDTYNYDNDVYFIVHEIAELLRRDDEKYINYKNYLNHPRISYTKNMMSTSMDN